MPQSELARRLGVHPITVSNWERGHRNWLSSLDEIAAALEVSPAVLVVNHREATLIDSVMDFLRTTPESAPDLSGYTRIEDLPVRELAEAVPA